MVILQPETEALRREVQDLLLAFLQQQLTSITPVSVDRVQALVQDAAGAEELRRLKTAIQYTLARDARSLAFLERTFLNWSQLGVPRWAGTLIEEAGFSPDRKLAKELGWYVSEEEELDVTQDKYYRFYRRS